MPITRVRSNVIGVARLCGKYVNTASGVKFHVQWGTDETKNKAPLWKPVEAEKIVLKSSQPQMIQLKAFSRDLRKNNGRNRIRTTWKTRSAFASSQFKMTVLPVVTGFLYRLRTQTIIRQKVYSTCFNLRKATTYVKLSEKHILNCRTLPSKALRSSDHRVCKLHLAWSLLITNYANAYVWELPIADFDGSRMGIWTTPLWNFLNRTWQMRPPEK